MKIIAPVSRIEEIDLLAAAGADEFYCGVVPREWVERFGTSGVSRRLFANLTGYDDLARAVDSAHRLGRRLSLALNAQHYSAEQHDALLELLRRYDTMGGDAVIIGDAALLGLLDGNDYRFDIHVSSIAACRNREAAQLYRDFGATRIILPRNVDLSEMKSLAHDLPDLEFEAFILNDGCVFEEGVCHTIHLPGHLGGPICMDEYRYEYRRIDGADLTADEMARFEGNETDYRSWLWYRFGCGFSVTEEGYPFGPCGLCALSQMREAGVAAVKIAGREAPSERKVRSVELVRRVIDEMDAADDEAAVARFAVGLRKQSEHCATGYMCYYPEVRPGALSMGSRDRGVGETEERISEHA